MGGDMPVMLDLELQPKAEAVGHARRSVEDLGEDLDPDVREHLRLLVSELVSNSVRHAELSASDRIRLQLAARDDRIRVEVTDPGDGFDLPLGEDPPPDSPSGWGLYLVDRIADRWGVEGNDTTTVWFELARSGALR
jgi:anti-sigma regulatory factor (Ser/Thr protein kinase)